MPKKARVFRDIDMSMIDRPSKVVRLQIPEEEVEELARSIEKIGLIHPILVNKKAGRYEIVAGDRRYLAHARLKRKKILAEVGEYSEKEVRLKRGMENLQRVDLTGLEEALIYTDLMESQEMSVEDIAQATGRSAGTIKRRLDVLRMPESFQKAIHARMIALSTAEELWSCPDAAHREYLLEMAVEHGVTKDVARMWVQDFKKAMRRKEDAGGGAPLETSVMGSDPIYRACDVCKDPVDYSKIKELRLCQECFASILQVLRGEG